MIELMKESLKGFSAWNAQGKFVGLFLAALLFLWLGTNIAKRREVFGLYVCAAAGAILCIFPPSSVLLMLYQTRFYDYRWVWTMVPMTILIAYAGVEVFKVYVEGKWNGTASGGKLKGAVIGIMMILVVVLSGNLGSRPEGVENTLENSARVETVLQNIHESYDRYKGVSEESAVICLWAPQEILSYTRAVDGQILLVYGCNMWDRYLDAYTYDTYDETREQMYLWMEEMAQHDTSAIALKGEDSARRRAEMDFTPKDTERMIQLACGQGVNVILLPETLKDEALALPDKMDCVVEQTGEYYLVMF